MSTDLKSIYDNLSDEEIELYNQPEKIKELKIKVGCRDATPEERAAVNKYIEEISKDSDYKCTSACVSERCFFDEEKESLQFKLLVNRFHCKMIETCILFCIFLILTSYQFHWFLNFVIFILTILILTYLSYNYHKKDLWEIIN